ncbi:MAG: hypothetical protein HZA54_12230 [Planctomycetes bacterium]|nr:hypothetical protein [Planctomycetota bacterium]
MSRRGADAELAARWSALYGDRRGAAALPRLSALVARWRARLAPARRARPRFDETDAVLIAYPDHLKRRGEAPLATLAAWCRARLAGCFSTVHVLPFHPSTSYEGYSISDYVAVDPRLGEWSDLARLTSDFRLMTDFVLNHCSLSHPWLARFRAGAEPERRFFIDLPDPDAAWLGRVRRARSSPLLHAVDTQEGTRYLWTTYARDLVDLNWRDPDLCLAMLEVLCESVARGAAAVRLDAFVYVWKRRGTCCVNQPETHTLIRLFQEVLRAVGRPDTAILPSITNVGQAENFAYLGARGSGRKADLIYLLPLSSMLLHALYAGDATRLAAWLGGMPAAPPGCAYLNLAASHDGVGLTWLRGLLPRPEVETLIAGARRRGALLSCRTPRRGARALPWELNTTWWSACAAEPGESPRAHLERFVATLSVVAALRGVPALYLPLFWAAENDDARVRRTGDHRAINRARYDLGALERAAARPGSPAVAAERRLTALLRARAGCRAFHPEGAQRVLDLGRSPVLALVRTPPGRSAGAPGRVLCVTNLGAAPQTLPSPAALVGGRRGGRWRDLLSGAMVEGGTPLVVGGYGVRWLRWTP